MLDKKLFNIIYSKYNKKDYFMLKEFTRNKLKYAKENNIIVKLSEVKHYLYNEKEKCYNMMLKRIEEKKQGISFPLREKFTHAIFKAMNIEK